MKIDESVIDKVLDNKAAPGEARKVAGWFVTEEGRKYLSGRLDREMEELAEEMPEDVRLPSISGMKMKQRWKSHSTLTLLATQNYPFLLKYDCPLWLK